MITPGCRLIESGFLCREEIQRLNNFFADDLVLGHAAKWEARLARSESGSLSENGEEIVRGCDAEQPVGADEWDPFEKEDTAPKAMRSNDWLRKVDLQAYSNLDFIMAVHRHRFALLTKSATTSLYEIALLCAPSFLKDDSEITCATAFGLGSTRKSERLDCVCIAVGTTEGQVAFYTEKGTLLFIERFANSPILDVSFEQFNDEQQICVSTENEVFLIQPFSMVSVLTQAKTAIAMGQQNYQELSDTLEIELERIEPENGGNFGSIVITGTQKPPSFDQYVTASTQDFTRRVDRPGLPNYSTLFITRPDKYLGDFVWHETGQKSGAWGTAVNQVANKVIPHFGLRKFLGWTKDDTRKTWAIGRSKMTAYTRGILGESRVAEWLVRAPDRPLIAVVDNHARVLLIDYNSRQIVRIWKGYRDARCLFITSKQDDKTALFLVIHAPRRDLIEIWSLQNGFRVSARHVPSNSLLLDGGGEMVLGSGSAELSSTAFLFLLDGRFLSIEVPYICALVRTSHEDHDKLYLAKLSSEIFTDLPKFTSAFVELKTIRGRRELVTNLMNSMNSSTQLLQFIDALEKIDSSISINDLLIFIRRLCTDYEKLSRWTNAGRLAKRKTFLKLCPTMEFSKLLSLHIDFESAPVSSTRSSFADFLAIINAQTGSTTSQLRKLSDKELHAFAHLIFDGFMLGKQPFDELFGVLNELPFDTENLAWLLSQWWVHSSGLPTLRVIVSLILLITKFINLSPNCLETFEKALLECEKIDQSIALYAVLIMIRCNQRKEIIEELSEARIHNEVVKEAQPQDVNLFYHDAQSTIYEETDDLPPVDLEGSIEERLLKKGVADEEIEETNEWEIDMVENETVFCWLRAGHVLSLLEKLGDPIEKQSFSRLFASGMGYFTEQLAKYVLIRGENAAELVNLLEALLVNPSNAPILCELLKTLPISLEIDRIRSESTWEAMSLWIKNKQDFEYLEQFCDFLPTIECDRLRHGICRLAWDTHLGELFKETAQIFDKTGRSLKDREARKHIGITDMQLPKFLSASLLCLRELLSSVKDSPPPLQIEHEEWLKTSFTKPAINFHQITSRASLCETISRQGLVNYHLVLHHLHLAMVLRLQHEALDRCHVIRNLFCDKGQRAFFLPFTSHPLLPLAKVDETIIERRRLWIEKVSETVDEETIELARELCQEWNLGVNDVIVGVATRLLREGKDTDASREIASLTHTERMARKMCSILAARVLRLSAEKGATVQQTTERQLRSLAGDEMTRVSLEEMNVNGWEISINSLGRVAASIHLPDLIARDFKEINSICQQNFSIRFW
ncbi:unnamed protein product, partial [Mesorhabditis belari]|uniref:Rab3 GTPase-activating protein non-catalytic subunit n=1 Tax=Mesorhabditis belari TaxID=2138241 RepID=A0AAF3FBF1_9BILA